MRRERLTDLRRARDDAGFVADSNFGALVFGPESPYAHSNLGNEASVSTASRDDLVERHRRALRPDRLSLLVAGDVSLRDAVGSGRGIFRRLVGVNRRRHRGRRVWWRSSGAASAVPDRQAGRRSVRDPGGHAVGGTHACGPHVAVRAELRLRWTVLRTPQPEPAAGQRIFLRVQLRDIVVQRSIIAVRRRQRPDRGDAGGGS